MLRAPAEAGDIKLLDRLLSRLEKRGKKALELELSATDFYGFTPLHWASWNGHISCVFSLIEYGANLNTRTKFGGQTPLMCAARHGHLDCVALLLEYGADPLAKDNDGRTAAKLSSGEAREAILLLLERESEREKERIQKGGDARTEHAHRQLHMHDTLLDRGKSLMKKTGQTVGALLHSHQAASKDSGSDTLEGSSSPPTSPKAASQPLALEASMSALGSSHFASRLLTGPSSGSFSDLGDITDSGRAKETQLLDSTSELAGGGSVRGQPAASSSSSSSSSKEQGGGLKSRFVDFIAHQKDTEIAELKKQVEQKSQEIAALQQELARVIKEKSDEIGGLMVTIDKLRLENDPVLALPKQSPRSSVANAASTDRALQGAAAKREGGYTAVPSLDSLSTRDSSSGSLSSYASARSLV